MAQMKVTVAALNIIENVLSPTGIMKLCRVGWPVTLTFEDVHECRIVHDPDADPNPLRLLDIVHGEEIEVDRADTWDEAEIARLLDAALALSGTQEPPRS